MFIFLNSYVKLDGNLDGNSKLWANQYVGRSIVVQHITEDTQLSRTTSCRRQLQWWYSLPQQKQQRGK